MRPSIDDPDGGRPQLFGLYTGEVTARNDPKKLGRVRVRIPGVLEPQSAWAFPFGVPGGGSADRGSWWIPQLGAEVAIFFKMGDPDHPYYTPSNWGRPDGESEVPTASSGGDPDVVVFAMGAYDLEVDTRGESKRLRIIDRADEENVLEYDGITKVLQISSTTAIRIESSGQIAIDGLIVTINGITAGLGQL